MSRVGTVTELLRYHDWARRRVARGVAKLAENQTQRSFWSGLGSLQATRYHLWASDRLWLDRWLGRPRTHALALDPSLSVNELESRCDEIERERDAFVRSVTDEALARAVSYVDTRGGPRAEPLGDLMIHVVNHGVHHRAQAQMLIRKCDGTPEKLDYLFLRLEEPTIELSPETRATLRGLQIEPAGAVASNALDVTTIRRYLEYSDWAGARVRSLAALLSDEDLDRDWGLGPGSVRKTLTHIRDAEAWWYGNWTQGPAPEFEELSGTVSLAELSEQSRRLSERRNRYLDSLTDADLAVVTRARPAPKFDLAVRLGESMLQLCTHGTHHRAQVVRWLRELGVTEPIDLDYVEWLRQPRS